MAEHDQHEMHENSLEAWGAIQDGLGKRHSLVIRAYREIGRPATDREVMKHCGFQDPNKVRPRIKDLIDDGRLAEIGSTIDPETGRTVRLVFLVPKQESLFA